MVNFEKSVDENNENNENNSTLDNFTIGKYSLESNCNNELTYFQFDKMPSCIRNECDKLLCKPLKDLNIDVSKIDKKLVKLGEGAFNDVFDITYDDDTPIVLRLLKIQRTNKKTIAQEQNGLVYQTRISKSIKEGGYGCPYIAKVHDFGIYDNKSVYAILEKCNMDLFDKMSDLYENQKSFSEHQLKNITRQTLEALRCLHQHNIYHLDLKTENIMFNDTENISDIKLIDFGSSVQSQGPEKDVLSSRHYGTPGYMSPVKFDRVGLEHSDPLNSPNPMDDLWSLGITLMKLIFMAYEMTPKGEYFYSKFPHNPMVTPRNYYNYTADVLVPTEKAYEEIQHSTLPNFSTSFSKECVTFLRRIFDTVSVEKNHILLNDTYSTLTAKDLLEDPWLKTIGGKRRTIRKKKNNVKHTKQKSKNPKKRSSKKH